MRYRLSGRGRCGRVALLTAVALVANLMVAMPHVEAAPSIPKVVLDADFGYATSVRDGVSYNSFPINLSIAQGVQALLPSTCAANIVVTNTGNSIDNGPRAAQMADADVAVTLSMNALPGGLPWGSDPSEGGSSSFATTRPDNLAFGNELVQDILTTTGRPFKAVNTGATNGAVYPYPEYTGLSGTYAQLFMLFIDNNFDFAVWHGAPQNLVIAITTAIGKTLEAKGFKCLGAFPTLPSAAELQRLRNLGYQQYLAYGAEPVSMSTGNFSTAERTFQLPGLGSQVIDPTLDYNAQSGQDSPVGVGWQFPYGAFLQQYGDGSILLNLADGRGLLYLPDGSGGFTSPAGAFATLTQLDATTYKWTTTTGMSMTFVQDASGRAALTSTTDRQGHTETLTYSGAGALFPKLATITDQAGQQVAVATNSDGRVTAFTRPDGAVWHLAYSGAGDLTSITSARGTVRSFSYDGQHRMVSEVGQDGVTFLTNTYDAQSRVVDQANAFGQHRSIVFDDSNHRTTYTDTNGAVTVYHWNALGEVTQIDDALGGHSATSYNTNLLPTSQTDPLNHTTARSYDGSGQVGSVTDPLGNVVSRTYNGSGDLTAATDSGGAGGAPRTVGYTVNSQGLPTTLTNPDGTTQQRSYNAAGDVASATDENGATTSYGYDGRGNTVSVTDPLGRVTAMAYDAADRLTSVTDPLSHTTSYLYDANDNLTKITYPNGSNELRSYDLNDQLASSTDRRGEVTTYTHDVELNTVAVTLPNGGTIRRTFDREDRLTSTVDPLGNVTRYTLDALGRTVATIDARGNTVATSYDPTGQIRAQTDASGATTNFTRDADGRVLTVTDPAGGVSKNDWDQVGRRSAMTDQLGHTTQYRYNFRDQLVAITDPAGGVTSNTYDAAGRLVKRTDPAGATTAFAYDAAGQQTTITDPLGGATSYGYDLAGNRIQVTDPNGHITKTSYDTMNQPISQTDGNGKVSTMQRDAAGLATAEVDPLGHRTGQTYTPLGDVATTVDPLGRTTTFGYDLAGRRTSRTAPDGVVTAYGLDAVANLVAVTQNARPGQPASTTVNVATSYSYDARNLLTTSTDANNATTTYSYDTQGRRVSETNAIGKITRYSYDQASNLATRVDANGVTTTYSYDARNLATKRAYPDGTAESFTYDIVGRQTAATNPTGTVTTTYDLLGRPTSVTDANGKKLVYSYDRAGNRSGLTLPDGRNLSYAYDAADQLTTLTSPLGALSTIYDAAGKPSKVTRPNGTATTFGFDDANQPTSMTTTKGASTVASFAYTYDQASNVATRSQRLGNKQTATTYTYDPLRRLTASVGGPLPSSYGYDAVGNRVAWSAPDDATTVIPGDAITQANTYNLAGQLTQSVDTHTYPLPPHSAGKGKNVTLQTDTTTNSYDNNGNLILSTDVAAPPGRNARSAFKYDFENRLLASGPANNAGEVCGWPAVGITGCLLNFNGDLAALQFPADWFQRTQTRTYDALGRPVTQKSGPTTTTWTDDGLNPILATDDGLSPSLPPTTTLYLRDGTGQLAGELAGKNDVAWYITDALNSIMGATNKAGNLGGSPTTYSDYGQAITRVNFRFGFNGQETDAHGSGLTHFYARSYDATTAGWVQPDSFQGRPAQPQTLGRYQFVGDNPSSRVDLLGFLSVGVANPGTISSVVNATPGTISGVGVSNGSLYGGMLQGSNGDTQFAQPTISLQQLQPTANPFRSYRSPAAYGQANISRDVVGSDLQSGGVPISGNISLPPPSREIPGIDIAKLIQSGGVTFAPGDSTRLCAATYGEESDFCHPTGLHVTPEAFDVSWFIASLGLNAAFDAVIGGGSVAVEFEGAFSPTLEVNGERFIYGDRVLARAVEEAGPLHNFPSSFDETILSQGTRTVVSDGYVEYTLPGTVNGVDGVYEIGTRPTGLGEGEVITHRFFRPGG